MLRSSWLPEPAAREQLYTVISVDDHVVEPPDAFTGRFPKRFASEEPRIVPGSATWVAVKASDIEVYPDQARD